jgi:anti-anti-sigma factor
VSPLARIEAEDRGAARLIRVSGEIDLSNAHDTMDAIGGLIPNHASLVVVDLSDTAYLDSTGIAMIFRLGERLRYRRQELRLVVPEDAPIRAVVELTNIQQVIPVDDVIDETPGPL